MGDLRGGEADEKVQRIYIMQRGDGDMRREKGEERKRENEGEEEEGVIKEL